MKNAWSWLRTNSRRSRPLKLKVKKGLATIKAGKGAQGARVLLVSGKERRPIKSLPIKIDIPTDKKWEILATRKGHNDYRKVISFEPGQAEQTFEIVLYEKGSEPPPKAPAGGSKAPPTDGGTKPPAGGGDKPKPASGNGTLNVNSIPASRVILDGRPLGQTPKTGISVSAG